jgi:hypothetical protein
MLWKKIENVVVVSHGVTVRAFTMMWCRRTPEVSGSTEE